MESPLARFDLPGGARLLVRENHDVAVATADAWIRTGAAHEPPELSGVSHFLEHMLFKGTARFGPGEIERRIENLGGLSNAATSYDYTHYYVTMPSAGLDEGVEMLSEMVCRSVVDPGELEKERLVILEEWRRKQDHPASALYEDVYRALTDSGPYRLPVLGDAETIRSIPRDAMYDYYLRRYAPANLTFVVCGDVEPVRVHESVARAFADFERPSDSPVEPREPIRPARAARRHRDRPTTGEHYVAFAIPAFGGDAPEGIVALDVAQFVLGQGRASLLYRELKERRGLVSSVSCSYGAKRHAGVFMVVATCAPEAREELSSATRAILAEFAAAPASEEDLRRAKRLLASAHRFSHETTGGVTSELGYCRTVLGDEEFPDRYLDELEATTAEDARAAFARILGSGETLLEASAGPGPVAGAEPFA